MKNKKIGKLNKDIKQIKIVGQGCLDDCTGTEMDTANGQYVAGGAVVCYAWHCPRKPVDPWHHTKKF